VNRQPAREIRCSGHDEGQVVVAGSTEGFGCKCFEALVYFVADCRERLELCWSEVVDEDGADVAEVVELPPRSDPDLAR